MPLCTTINHIVQLVASESICRTHTSPSCLHLCRESMGESAQGDEGHALAHARQEEAMASLGRHAHDRVLATAVSDASSADECASDEAIALELARHFEEQARSNGGEAAWGSAGAAGAASAFAHDVARDEAVALQLARRLEQQATANDAIVAKQLAEDRSDNRARQQGDDGDDAFGLVHMRPAHAAMEFDPYDDADDDDDGQAAGMANGDAMDVNYDELVDIAVTVPPDVLEARTVTGVHQPTDDTQTHKVAYLPVLSSASTLPCYTYRSWPFGSLCDCATHCWHQLRAP
jgi:hypothetical protein